MFYRYCLSLLIGFFLSFPLAGQELELFPNSENWFSGTNRNEKNTEENNKKEDKERQPLAKDLSEAKTAQEQELGQKALADIKRDMQLSQHQIHQLTQEIEALKNNQGSLSQELVTSAARARQLAKTIQRRQKSLGSLLLHKSSIEQVLAARRQEIVLTLAVLERIGLRPPPAMLAQTDDVLQSLRASSLLDFVMTDLHHRAQDLRKDLAEIEKTEQRIREEKQQIETDLQQGQIEDRRLILLLDEKKQAQQHSEQQREILQEQTSMLARKAQSVAELVEDLEKNARQNGQGKHDQARLIPIETHFSHQYGNLSLPVSGIKLQSFDQDFQGELYETHPGAMIVTPADGTVRYAGPFRSYGQLLIIDAGQNYHLILAGMEQIHVQQGQVLLAGEPVGTMALLQSEALPLSTDQTAELAKTAPVLYVEIRQEGVAVDPAPWWAAHL